MCLINTIINNGHIKKPHHKHTVNILVNLQGEIKSMVCFDISVKIRRLQLEDMADDGMSASHPRPRLQAAVLKKCSLDRL